MWVETQKHQEEVQLKVEKQKTSAESKTWIEQKSKKIADTLIWKKVWETINVNDKIWAKKAWEKLKWILSWNENNEKTSEIEWRSDILKNLDVKIIKTLPEGQSIDKIAKILKKPDWTNFSNIAEAKDFLREQFLKWEIKDLDKPLIDTSWNILRDKNWDKITVFSKILEKNSILWDIERENSSLAKDIISLYWEKILNNW